MDAADVKITGLQGRNGQRIQRIEEDAVIIRRYMGRFFFAVFILFAVFIGFIRFAGFVIGQRISFDPVGMFLSILQIVIVPIALGLIVKSFLPKLADTAADYLPAVSALAISFLIAGIIGASRDAILNSSGIILLVVILHNCLGYALGFFIGHLCGMSWKKMVALSIEVGMQNSGLATGLAKAHFASLPMAGVPGAVFSAWHNKIGRASCRERV